MDKKQLQLGMNPSTASARLVKDLLFAFAVAAGHTCFRCGEALNRESFSVEHKQPWLDSVDPRALFFDQGNIAYSHALCNSRVARKPHKHVDREAAAQRARERHSARMRSRYTPESRREKFLRTGY